jgi:hypothetical protein
LTLLIERSFPTAAITLLNTLDISHEHSHSLQTLLANTKNNANIIATAINEKLRVINPVQISYPSIRWANNLTHVFIGVKYAPKFASPGYLEYNIKNEKINLTRNAIFLSAEVQEEAKTIRYVANFKLFGLVVEANSSVEHESVGRIYIILKKLIDVYWPKLSDDSIPNLVVWWEMKEKYPTGDEDSEEAPKKRKKPIKQGMILI